MSAGCTRRALLGISINSPGLLTSGMRSDLVECRAQ